MPSPSPGYSITVRVEAPTDPAATARLSSVVAEAGGAITALDVAEGVQQRVRESISHTGLTPGRIDITILAIEHHRGSTIR